MAEHVKQNLDRDPNDPRNVAKAGALKSLNKDEPEKKPVKPQKQDVVVGNVTKHLGVDPNDPR